MGIAFVHDRAENVCRKLLIIFRAFTVGQQPETLDWNLFEDQSKYLEQARRLDTDWFGLSLFVNLVIQLVDEKLSQDHLLSLVFKPLIQPFQNFLFHHFLYLNIVGLDKDLKHQLPEVYIAHKNRKSLFLIIKYLWLQTQTLADQSKFEVWVVLGRTVHVKNHVKQKSLELWAQAWCLLWVLDEKLTVLTEKTVEDLDYLL